MDRLDPATERMIDAVERMPVWVPLPAVVKRKIGVNDLGLRVGQDHQNAKLTDAEVETLLRFREQGWGYKRLAAKFEISKAQVRRICSGLARHQIPTRYRLIAFA